MPFQLCPGCQTEKEVLDSHLIPKRVYEYVRAKGMDPVLMTDEMLHPTQRQIHAYLLCRDCEDMLNEGGEKWSVGLFAEQMGPFPLFEMLDKQAVVHSDSEVAVYAAWKIPGFQANKLAHLALGILWKASVHSCRKGRKLPRIELGDHSNKLRLFLKGEGQFPADMALLAWLTPTPVKDVAFDFPREMRATDARQFLFYLPGMKFQLVLTNQIETAHIFCLASGPFKALMVEDLTDELRMVFKHGTKTAYRTRKFAEYAEIARKMQSGGG